MKNEICNWPLGCKRKATTYSGWDDAPLCEGHGRLGRFNKDSHCWGDLSEDEQNRMLVHRLAIREWFYNNPEPKEIETTNS